jgi:hypothetical protein
MPRSTTSLRNAGPVTTLEDDDDEFDVSRISNVCIKPLIVQGRKYLLFTTHLNDDDIPQLGTS